MSSRNPDRIYSGSPFAVLVFSSFLQYKQIATWVPATRTTHGSERLALVAQRWGFPCRFKLTASVANGFVSKTKWRAAGQDASAATLCRPDNSGPRPTHLARFSVLRWSQQQKNWYCSAQVQTPASKSGIHNETNPRRLHAWFLKESRQKIFLGIKAVVCSHQVPKLVQPALLS